jgi:hypothetical protein
VGLVANLGFGRELYLTQLLDLLIDATPTDDLDWCADPTDLQRALARRLKEVDPAADHAHMPEHEKLARVRLAQEFERVVPH